MSRITTLTAIALLTLVSACILTGCGQSAQAAMAGVYELDKAKIKADMQTQIDATEDEQEKMGMQMMAGFIDAMTMTLTLNEDGTATGVFTAMGDTENATGTWTINGDSISVTLGSGDEEPDTMSGTVDGDTFELVPPGDDESDMPPFNLAFKKRTEG